MYNLPLIPFCALPISVAKASNGATIGYSMSCVHGYRLDRYAHQFAKKRGVNISKVIKLFLNVTIAVRAVHLSDFVICDLCQSNFMVTRGGHIKVVAISKLLTATVSRY